MRVYLAGPLGFYELSRSGQDKLVRELVKLGYKVLDPFKLTRKGDPEGIARLGRTRSGTRGVR